VAGTRILSFYRKKIAPSVRLLAEVGGEPWEDGGAESSSAFRGKPVLGLAVVAAALLGTEKLGGGEARRNDPGQLVVSRGCGFRQVGRPRPSGFVRLLT